MQCQNQKLASSPRKPLRTTEAAPTSDCSTEASFSNLPKEPSNATDLPSGGPNVVEIANRGGLTIEPVRVSSTGLKTANVVYDGGRLQWFTPWSRIPFHPRKFHEDSSDKVSLALVTNDLTLEMGEALDKWAIAQATLNSLQLFGRTLSPTEIVRAYKPIISKSGDFKPLIKSKIWMDGALQIRVWDESGIRRTVPQNFRDFEARAAHVLKGFWFHSGKFGLTLETPDMQVRGCAEAEVRCPFISTFA